MADTVSPDVRSRNMSRIRSRNTLPEIFFRKRLFSMGYRYRINCRDIVGRPDIWLPKYKTAIFVNGCFWHRHENCKFAYTPKTRVEFWNSKFSKNRIRDEFVKEQIEKLGYKYVVVWECTVKRMMKSQDVEHKVLNELSTFLFTSIEKELIV